MDVFLWCPAGNCPARGGCDGTIVLPYENGAAAALYLIRVLSQQRLPEQCSG
jgi:hypothetical protein